jgi:hypothetical protein
MVVQKLCPSISKPPEPLPELLPLDAPSPRPPSNTDPFPLLPLHPAAPARSATTNLVQCARRRDGVMSADPNGMRASFKQPASSYGLTHRPAVHGIPLQQSALVVHCWP